MDTFPTQFRRGKVPLIGNTTGQVAGPASEGDIKKIDDGSYKLSDVKGQASVDQDPSNTNVEGVTLSAATGGVGDTVDANIIESMRKDRDHSSRSNWEHVYRDQGQGAYVVFIAIQKRKGKFLCAREMKELIGLLH
ncbi:hypothetical protein GGR54DRAFT_650805 [Hypoxylon sp. NC1633]|nr:hypothetical protein GGR54DRAFT_650805 [Hypoxylon sp. NC1633]